MTTKYGFFSEHEYLTPTGQKRSWKQGPGKEKGESATAKAALRAGFASKTGKLNDATFSKHLSLHAGDQYQDAGTRLAARRLAVLAAQKSGAVKQDGRVFKPASPCKKATAKQAGEEHGTISSHYPHTSNHAPTKSISQGKPVQTKAWIASSPHKLGTYGFNLTTLSERKGAQGVAGEYAYKPDPYPEVKAATKAADKAAPIPFKPPRAASAGDTFSTFKHIPPGTVRSAKGEKVGGPAFVPPHSGCSEPLNPPAEYFPSPPTTKSKDVQQGEAAERAKYGSFKPTFHYRTVATPSIVRMNPR